MPFRRHSCQSFPNVFRSLLALVFLVIATGSGVGQEKNPTANFVIKRFQTGFPSQDQPNLSYAKSGLWSPVHVVFEPVAEGGIRLDTDAAGFTDHVLRVSFQDSDGVYANYFVPLQIKAGLPATIVSYADFGNVSLPELQLAILKKENLDGNPIYSSTNTQLAETNGTREEVLPFGDHLYVTMGNKIPALFNMLDKLEDKKDDNDTGQRKLSSITTVADLPDLGFGYEACDLIILTSGQQQFIEQLSRSRERIHALSNWVKRGGRLVVSLSWQQQDMLAKIFRSPSWNPAVPEFMNGTETIVLESGTPISNFANARGKPLRPRQANAFRVVKLIDNPSFESILRSDRDESLIQRIPYGLGSITVLAFAVDDGPVIEWTGQQELWTSLIGRLAPILPSKDLDNQQFAKANLTGEANKDLSSRLYRNLDNFEVPRISFGWVAAFILIYILIVGPVDYFLLKKVFKRLEWTWVTFPAIVLIVSALAYVSAYAMRGDQLKINKVDLLDIDMRTSIDVEGKTKKVFGYGSSWFSILSPRIQNYTFGIQPAVGQKVDLANPESPPNSMVTWITRAESQAGGGLYNTRSYNYAEDARGVENVPVPVWSTKSFRSTWDLEFAQSPLEVDLYYRENDPDQKISGTIRNKLPINLEDVQIVYGEDYVDLGQDLPGMNAGSPAIPVDFGWHNFGDMKRWAKIGGAGNASNKVEAFSPLTILRDVYFHEKIRLPNQAENYALRNLDQTWRLRNLRTQRGEIRTAIILATIPRVEGSLQKLTSNNDPHLLTQLWIGILPGEGEARPVLPGNLTQYSAIRVLVPVRPK